MNKKDMKNTLKILAVICIYIVWSAIGIASVALAIGIVRAVLSILGI